MFYKAFKILFLLTISFLISCGGSGGSGGDATSTAKQAPSATNDVALADKLVDRDYETINTNPGFWNQQLRKQYAFSKMAVESHTGTEIDSERPPFNAIKEKFMFRKHGNEHYVAVIYTGMISDVGGAIYELQFFVAYGTYRVLQEANGQYKLELNYENQDNVHPYITKVELPNLQFTYDTSSVLITSFVSGGFTYEEKPTTSNYVFDAEGVPLSEGDLRIQALKAASKAFQPVTGSSVPLFLSKLLDYQGLKENKRSAEQFGIEYFLSQNKVNIFYYEPGAEDPNLLFTDLPLNWSLKLNSRLQMILHLNFTLGIQDINGNLIEENFYCMTIDDTPATGGFVHYAPFLTVNSSDWRDFEGIDCKNPDTGENYHFDIR